MSALWNWVSPNSWWLWWNSTPTSSRNAAERSVALASLRQAHECGICHEDMRYPRLLDCLHAFCSDCLKKHYSASRRSNTNFCPALLTCPICKEDSMVHYADPMTSMRHDVAFGMAEVAFRASVLACMNELAAGEGRVELDSRRTTTQAFVSVGAFDELRVSIERTEGEMKRAANDVYSFLDDSVDLHEEMRSRAHDLVARDSEHERDHESVVEMLRREFGTAVEKMIIRDRQVFESYVNAKADRLLVELVARFYEWRLGHSDVDTVLLTRCFENLERFDTERATPKAIYGAARYLLDFDTKHESRADAPLDDDAVRCIGELRNYRGRVINEAMRRDAFYANAFLFRSSVTSVDTVSTDLDSLSLNSYSTVNKAGLGRAGIACSLIWRVGQRAPLSSNSETATQPLGTFEWCTHANFLDYTRAHSARGVICDKMNRRLQLIDLSTGTCCASLLDGCVRPRRVAQLPDERVAVCDEYGETLKLFDIRSPGGAQTQLGHTSSSGQSTITDLAEWEWPTGDAESAWRSSVNNSLGKIADGAFRCCAGLAVTTDGELACADADRGFLCTINPNSGVVTTKFTTRFLDDRYVPHPYFVAVDASESISVAINEEVQISDEDAIVGVESNNDVLIASDTQNNVVKLYSRRGRVLNSIGGFRCARGICADARGRLYVADADNHRIALHDASGKYMADAVDASDGVCYPMSVALNRNCDLLLLTQCGVYTSHKVSLVRIDEQFENRIDVRTLEEDGDDETANSLTSRNPLLSSRESASISVTSVQVK